MLFCVWENRGTQQIVKKVSSSIFINKKDHLYGDRKVCHINGINWKHGTDQNGQVIFFIHSIHCFTGETNCETDRKTNY